MIFQKKKKCSKQIDKRFEKKASKKWHLFLISRLESRACEAMYRSRGKPV